MSKLLKATSSTILIAKPGKSRDMAHLNVPATRNALCGLGISAQKDLQDSVISYRRHKTGTLLTVEVPPTAMKLFNNIKAWMPTLLTCSPSSVETEKAKKNTSNTNMPCGN